MTEIVELEQSQTPSSIGKWKTYPAYKDSGVEWKTYPAYKDSGVEWLGEIPEHWEVKRLKFVAAMNTDVLSEDTNPDYLLKYVDISNVDSNGLILTEQEFRFEDAPSRARRKVEHKDVIISTVRTYLRAICLIEEPAENLVVSTGFAVLRANLDTYYKFLWRLLQSREFVNAVVSHSVGVGYPAINPGRLADLPVWLPSPGEQHAIATFLDRETGKTNELIARKERLIELLQEKRAALISHAVTKGLDPDVKMRDSGVAWLGEIPAHWEVRRLKFMADVLNGVAKGRDLGQRDTVELPYLRVANVQDGYLDLSDIATIPVGLDEIERFSLHVGDVLMNEGGDFDKLARGYVWNGEISPCLHQNHVFAVRPHAEIDPYWLSMITLTSYAKHYFILKSKQSTNLASISATNLKELPVVMPPDAERIEILSYIKEETARIDALISRIGEAIEKLKEYSAALISAAVTGKIDVRGEVGNYREK